MEILFTKEDILFKGNWKSPCIDKPIGSQKEQEKVLSLQTRIYTKN